MPRRLCTLMSALVALILVLLLAGRSDGRRLVPPLELPSDPVSDELALVGLVSAVEGSPTNVIGLNIPAVLAELEGLGVIEVAGV